MKHIKLFENFDSITKESADDQTHWLKGDWEHGGGLGQTALRVAAGALMIGTVIIPIVYLIFYVIQSSNRFSPSEGSALQSLKRWVKISRVLRKYKPLIKDIDDKFKDDPKVKKLINDIMKKGHNTTDFQNQNPSSYFAHELKDYIINNYEGDKKEEVENMLSDMESEIKEIW